MGKLTIVGIGPGDRARMTSEAIETLLEADLVCGYARYVELIADLIGDTETLATGMTGEIERCPFVSRSSRRRRNAHMGRRRRCRHVGAD